MSQRPQARPAEDGPHPLDQRTRVVLRRGSAVLVAVGLASSLGVYWGHPWFHETLLPALGVSPALGDSIGGFIIILAAYLGQRIVSLALFRDTELGSTRAARQLELSIQGLQAALGELDRLAGTDKLTEAWSRRRLEEAVRGEMDRLARYDHPLSLLVLDVDLFKAVNDRHGYHVGDQVLVELAQQLRAALRASDSITRWGGEEFVVLCPNTTLATASLLAARLREKIAKMTFPEVGRMTVSIGVAECMPAETWETWFQRADAALYQAKVEGRNRVRTAPETPQRGAVGERVAARFVQLAWRPAYECGHDMIDREHRALFDHANDLLAAMLSGLPAEEAGATVDAFLRDIQQHFRDEEAIIAAAGFPAAKAHAAAHRELNAKAQAMAENFRRGVLEASELFQFLTHDVVTRHMLGADREFFAYLTQRRIPDAA